MIFEGIGRTFSTVGNTQYEAIGAFWDGLAARFGREALQGLGFGWTDDTIEYCIAPKTGVFPEDMPLPEGCERKTLILPDGGWTRYTGQTDRLAQLYDTIYSEGVPDFEIERFRDDGVCEVDIFRRARVPDALSAIAARHSYRGRYCSYPVPLTDLKKIVAAGLDAPSGCNKQTTSIAAVNTPEMMRKLLAAIDPPIAESAPAGLFVLTRRITAYRGKCFAVQDYAAAIQNMLLAITALGYASCWIEGHITDEDRICDKLSGILGIPEGYEMVCFLPVGIPEQTPKAPPKKPEAERAFYIECRE